MRVFKARLIFCWLFVPFNIAKTLMVLLLCLTFVGQAMATTIMSYHMIGMTAQEQSQDMPQMEHRGHHITSDATADESKNSTEDCCVKTCNCFTGSCSSVAVLVSNINNDAIIVYSSKINILSSLAQSQQLTSLYKPPISS